jgi:hypothetical protein
MPSLNRDQRRLLENTVARARGIAAGGARKVLTDQYAVHHYEPWPHMTPEERELRNQLRAHGRQLGDRRDDRSETQEIDHLVQACAYEHWHRMLFARFLAENDLLLDPDHGMAMTLEEVRELSREQNREWIEIAAELAQKMLLAVFRPDDPVLRVSLPPETRQQLEEKLGTLPAEVFQADDSLGWVYQFWQRDEKDRVNKSEVKIGADELPAVTQLFTEDYMVLFLLENTLGSWWTAKRLAEGKDPALPGYEWTYLRLNEDGSPAAGSFDSWPRAARDLRMLDPCMGSGHFLVFALPILVHIRIEEDTLPLKEALASVLKENLYGLEIDARCSQIAAFNLALAAWRLAGEHFPLPQLNLACSGLGIHASESDWIKLAGDDGLAREEMRRLYSLFKDAPILGSLIDPLRLSASVYSAGADRVMPLIEEALQHEQADETRELVIAAQGVLEAFRILAAHFTLVATNVPYLGRSKQSPVLAKYCAEFHSDAKADLATCLWDRCIRFANPRGTTALVTKHEPLFQPRYQAFRERFLRMHEWHFVARLGAHAFETITGEVVKAALVAVSSGPASTDHNFFGRDVSKEKGPAEKAVALETSSATTVLQHQQLSHPGAVVSFEDLSAKGHLGDFACSYQGLSTADNPQFLFSFWEFPAIHSKWRWLQGAPESTSLVSGASFVLLWEDGLGRYYRHAMALKTEGRLGGWKSGREAWGRPGVIAKVTRPPVVSLYLGEMFDATGAVIIPNDQENLAAVYQCVSSREYAADLEKVDQALSVTELTFLKVPFDSCKWAERSAENFPSGLPAPSSSDPTQWVFYGHPKGSDYPLHVAVSRLVGYRWPRQTGSTFTACPALGQDGLEAHVDADGIVPLSSIAGDASAADRVRAVLSNAFTGDWSAAKLKELLGGCESLESWLRDQFFEEHCEIFHQRPFIWHVWDGRKDGFHALVNYHKLAGVNGEGRKTMEKLIYTYLGRWIERQSHQVSSGVEGADARLAAALHLKSELEKILVGEKPYDIFVRWKRLDEQPIGWEPDLEDGVRLNIRPWLTAKPYAPEEQKNGKRRRSSACTLRVTPSMPFGRDRGREPHRPKDDFPWFWSWDEQADDFLGGKEFDGARWNDLHYSLETKRNARLRAQAKGSSK